MHAWLHRIQPAPRWHHLGLNAAVFERHALVTTRRFGQIFGSQFGRHPGAEKPCASIAWRASVDPPQDASNPRKRRLFPKTTLNVMFIRDLCATDVELVRALLAANGWAGRVADAERFAALLANSQRTAVAVDSDQIVGFARGITDGLSNGYLSMVVVAEAHRGQGVGRSLVEHVVGKGTDVTWVLRAGRDGAAAFFEKLGFSASSIAMERTRVTTEA
jgi:ribosomal protein S18 acetylase RimI-like enzyme